MAVSDTYVFNPDIGDIVEEAYEQAGLELRSGYDLRTARRSLNLITLEWQNRGLNLWTMTQETISADSAGTSLGSDNYLNKGTASYNIATSTSTLFDLVLRTNAGEVSSQSDYHLNRISQPTYATIPNKLTQARPLQYYPERKEILNFTSSTDQSSTITLWPVPDKDSTYSIIYWRMKRIADTGNDASETAGVPDRFIPALISGLAYQIALKNPSVSDRVQMLKQLYEEQFQLAAEEDRVKTSAMFVPRISGY